MFGSNFDLDVFVLVLTVALRSIGALVVLGVELLPRGLTFGGIVTDVVALVVVGMIAEVLLVLGSHDATLGRLLDGQAYPATLEIEIDDLDPQLFAR